MFRLTTLLLALVSIKLGEASGDSLLFHGNALFRFRPDIAPLQHGFSACGWVRKLHGSRAPTWLDYATGDTNELHFRQDLANTIVMGGNVNSRFAKVGPAVPLTRDGLWRLYCVTHSSMTRNIKLYLDGALLGTAQSTSGRVLAPGGWMGLGNDLATSGASIFGSSDAGALKGQMYNLNVYRRELLGEEITLLFGEGLCGHHRHKYHVHKMFEVDIYLDWEEMLLIKKYNTGNVVGQIEEVQVCSYSD